jgi:spore maturation protein CgeB
VAHLGALRRKNGGFILLFHDTHHRGVSDAGSIADLALAQYDAVLAFGETLRPRYERQGWGRRVFTWHEAADTRLFTPRSADIAASGLVWIGNWGDGERSQQLTEFLIEPASRIGLSGTVHGVRYPAAALERLHASPLAYRGWIANADVPAAFAEHRMTVHVPRRAYVKALPGIPTIRVFEAPACGIPLVSASGTMRKGYFARARTSWWHGVARRWPATWPRCARTDPLVGTSAAPAARQATRDRLAAARRPKGEGYPVILAELSQWWRRGVHPCGQTGGLLYGK